MNEQQNIFTAVALDNNFISIEEDGVRNLLVIGTNRAMLVDTGYGKGDLKAFVKTLTDLPVFVVITHADGDHVSSNPLFGEAMMHPAEFPHYRNSQSAHASVKLLPVWEGDVIDLGNRKFEVILIPGHTPGSIALLDRENRILIGGDSIQPGPIYMFGQYRNMDGLHYSMLKMKQYQNRFDIVLSSHGPISAKADIIDDIIAASKSMMEGKIKGVPPGKDLPCLLYDCGKVKFYY